jgi:hypothetical protein
VEYLSLQNSNLNPIEMLWHKLKKWLSKQEPENTKAELVRHTLEF